MANRTLEIADKITAFGKENHLDTFTACKRYCIEVAGFTPTDAEIEEYINSITPGWGKSNNTKTDAELAAEAEKKTKAVE